MLVYELLLAKFELFLILFMRVLGLFVTLPVYGERGIPVQIKVGLALFLAYLVFPLVVRSEFALPRTLGQMVAALAGEFLIGLMIGFTVMLLLGAVHVAGAFVGFQMGFAIVNVVDPAGSQVSLIGRFQELMATVLFFALNLDHYFVLGVLDSFRAVPPLGIHLSAAGLQVLVDQSVAMWVAAVKIGAPVTVALFAANAAMGLVARSVPQMNVFIVGFPVTIGVGLVLLGLSLPVFVGVFRRLAMDLVPVIDRLVWLAR